MFSREEHQLVHSNHVPCAKVRAPHCSDHGLQREEQSHVDSLREFRNRDRHFRAISSIEVATTGLRNSGVAHPQ